MSDTDKNPPRDYEVGRGKPPVETRWQPGQSGNPKGRKRAEGVDLLHCIDEALSRRVTIPINGKPRKMPVQKALAHKIVADATMGNASARRDLMKLLDFAAKMKIQTGWTIIDARPVLEDAAQEEDRVKRFARESEELRRRIKELEERLQGDRAGGEAEPSG